MKVAVTGGRGRVGRYVVADLLAHGYALRVLTRTPWPECPKEAEVVPDVDITDFDKLMEAFKGCDAVMHIANIPGPKDDNRPDTFINNISGNYNVMLAAGLLGIKRLVIAGSNCAVGFCRNHNFPDPDYFPLDEEHPCRPDDCYGIGKYLSEVMAERMVQRFPDLSIATLRISMVIDPGSYSQVTKVDVEQANSMAPFHHNLGTYIDARDSAKAFRLAMESDFTGAEVFFICNPDSLSDAPVGDFLKKRFPNVPVRTILGDHDALESAQKAKRMLGWEPDYLIRDEIAKYL